MNNISLLKLLGQYIQNTSVSKDNPQNLKHPFSIKSNSGFTLIELLVVVLIIGALSAIAAPGWLAFVERQRIKTVNDGIFSAIQEAQRQAKQKKLDYSVSFRQKSDEFPKYAVHLATSSLTDLAESDWKKVIENTEIKPDQVLLCSNINPAETNQKLTTADCDLKENARTRTITFDYQGNLLNKSGPPAPGLTMTVGVPEKKPNPTKILQGTSRCVVVTTLLGAMRIDQGAYKEPSTTDPQSVGRGCPSP